ncbi:type IV toxin-antitoxin system AbiEi family antitoxin [Pantoea sp. B65]|uniref:type IV toxin-antitoxin system AbiEi family antitoxin n=1 Tax=Pantoea sp. B65 TaxID=2813359 RepID=UPI0039B6C825
MNTKVRSKINSLISIFPSGAVFTSLWLAKQGYSLDLQQHYKKTKWLESIGSGAVIRNGDQVDYLGGVYALQSQLGLSIHPAAKTALSLQGKAHYLALAGQKAQLFGATGEKLPKWFESQDWGMSLDCKLSSFLPSGAGLVAVEYKGFSVKVSGPARAIMECLYLAPKYQPLMEVYELMEGLNNLRPVTVQKLLEGCSSVKVKRLFLYLADKAGHEWFNHIDLDKIDLGAGKRAIVKGGVYIPEYQITVPKELESVI